MSSVEPEASSVDRNSLKALEAARNDGKTHLLLAASGSVATIKIPNIVNALSSYIQPGRLSVRLILTSSAQHFLADQSPEQPSHLSLPHLDGIYTDDSEWNPSWTRGSGVLHIELRRWADILVIAPLSANTLAKIVNGVCDNLLTSVVRAWDVGGRIDGGGKEGKRILVAPAMNTAMWLHPITAKQISVLRDDWGVKSSSGNTHVKTEDAIAGSQQGWFEVLMPQQKTLACGDIGDGAMKEWTEILEIIETRLKLKAGSN